MGGCSSTLYPLVMDEASWLLNKGCLEWTLLPGYCLFMIWCLGQWGDCSLLVFNDWIRRMWNTFQQSCFSFNLMMLENKWGARFQEATRCLQEPRVYCCVQEKRESGFVPSKLWGQIAINSGSSAAILVQAQQGLLMFSVDCWDFEKGVTVCVIFAISWSELIQSCFSNFDHRWKRLLKLLF